MGILRAQFASDVCLAADGGMAEWLKATDCKSVLIEYAGSNPAPSTTTFQNLWVRKAFTFERAALSCAGVAQW